MNNSKSVTSLVDSRCGVWGVSHQVPNLTSALLTDDPVVSGVAIVLALWWGQAVLIPVVLSVLISYALEPLIARLECWRVKRVIAVPLVLTVLLAAAGSGAYALRGEAVAFVNRLSGRPQGGAGHSGGDPGNAGHDGQGKADVPPTSRRQTFCATSQGSSGSWH